ncbi:MAG: HlyD family efflux transporter periplasmic adaptor subunit [Planctomycetes bacterium]|jgi:HlyD family secretion protein|nr:HlyD family efflux transporter periplasmic adaptor subunit [Planctomycetota bacterium]
MDIPRKSAKRRKIIRRGLIATTGLILVAGVTVGVSRLKPAAPGVDRRTLWLDKVKRSPMLREVRGVGTLVSEDILLVTAVVAGRVIRILVEPGAPVEPNTVLLELDNPELELELFNAETQWKSAVANERAQKASLRADLLQRQAGLAQHQASYDEAKLTLEVHEKEYQNDLISLQQITLSRARVKQTENLLEINRQCLEMYEKESMPAQLADTEATVAKAKSFYDLKFKHVESLHVRAGTAGILAPITNKIEPGQSVGAGTVVAKITNPKRLKAQLKVPEAQAGDVIIGLAALVDTHHGTVSGKVSRKDPTPMEGNIAVDVSLTGALPHGAVADLSVVGTITIEKLDDVLNVGRPVFASSEGPSELFKVERDGRHAVRSRVQFGRTSVSTIEVLEGLQIGDEIILSDMSQWDGCDRIRLK